MIPAISVILPCFGVGNLIRLSFQDLCKQSFSDFEMIFVNDGDDALDCILAEISEIDDRVRVLKQPNGGVSSARNLGFFNARGKYIVIADPDDRMESYYLESLYNSVADTDSDIGIGGCRVRYLESGTTQKLFLQELKNVSLQDALPAISMHYIEAVTWNKIYKRELVEKAGLSYPVGVSARQDAIFFYELFTKAQTFSTIKDCGYVYILGERDNATTRYHKDLKQYSLKLNELYSKVLSCARKSDAEIQSIMTERYYLSSYFSFVNLFHRKCNLSYIEKVKYVQREILSEPLFMTAYSCHNKSKDNRLLKLYCWTIDNSNPYVMVAIFASLYYVKNQSKWIYAHLISLLRATDR